MAQAYKFTTARRRLFLDLVRAGKRRGAAAQECGVSRETVRLHMARDPAFAAEVEDAELDAVEKVEDALYQAALAGNVVAAQVWLYNRAPDRWQDRRNLQMKAVTEHTGKDGGALVLRVVYDDGTTVNANVHSDADPAAD
jgi:hypothetical protein